MNDEVKKIIEQLQVRVDEANQKAENIIREAEANARQIIAQANTTAEEKIHQATAEITRREQAHQEKLKQTVRDTLIELKTRTLQSVLKKTFETTLQKPLTDPQFVQTIILTLGKEFAKSFNDDLKVLLGPELFDKLGTTLKQQAHTEIMAGLEVGMERTLKGGFKIGPAKEGYMYDFSEEALTELFATAYGAQLESFIFSATQ
ncbi:hypothetical protein L0128_16680 [candidate division KSB1 bacterium]|nr:hypothetical protein [candidate division KSB1 bacterium]